MGIQTFWGIQTFHPHWLAVWQPTGDADSDHQCVRPNLAATALPQTSSILSLKPVLKFPDNRFLKGTMYGFCVVAEDL